ncbi:ferredoxin 2 [hydrocarbon metagenome]|uniref:Ferredoxin 2 n=1 Tax=hydrocarbon metagenome TaxID=938273 RepID=A0A0W8FTW9_9ZZZZ
MNSNNRGGRGMGGGQGAGRMGGARAAGVGGNCLCTKCGYREPHERGIPCMQKKCPQCGSTLIRE